jgi:chromosome partitioning protein
LKTISIVNLKGGVGKTVTAVNLAGILAADYGKRVLLVDVDHQGNASRYCGVDTEERGGLAALLTGGAVCYDEVIEFSTMPGVDVIPADMSLATLGVDSEYTSQMAVRAMRDLRDARPARRSDRGRQL